LFLPLDRHKNQTGEHPLSHSSPFLDQDPYQNESVPLAILSMFLFGEPTTSPFIDTYVFYNGTFVIPFNSKVREVLGNNLDQFLIALQQFKRIIL
jgi:hypothetical protein